MKYILYIPSFVKKLELKINKNEFDELDKAKKFLHYIVSHEESYDILISNYIEFEQEILQLTMQNMMYSPYSTNIFYELRMKLNKRLINLLTSVKLYQDLGLHQIPKCFNERGKYQNEIRNLLANEYDNNNHYKFIDELRKYTQHAGLAVHLTSFNMNKANSQREYSINLSSYIEKLKKDKMFNATKFSEMDDEIDLKLAVRHYIESISFVHDSIRKLFETFTKKSRKTIESAHAKFKEQLMCNTDYLRAACIKNNSKIKDIAILLDWDDVRIMLQQKNKRLTRLSQGYITSISKEKTN